MAFDKDVYADGESTYEVPYWRKVIEEVSTNVDTFDYQEEFDKRRRIRENEVGLKHPNNNSYVKIKDDGTIEMFSDSGTGIRVRQTGDIQFFGDFQFIGSKFQGITRTNEASFNGEKVSGEYPSIEVKGLSDELKDLISEMEAD